MISFNTVQQDLWELCFFQIDEFENACSQIVRNSESGGNFIDLMLRVLFNAPAEMFITLYFIDSYLIVNVIITLFFNCSYTMTFAVLDASSIEYLGHEIHF